MVRVRHGIVEPLSRKDCSDQLLPGKVTGGQERARSGQHIHTPTLSSVSIASFIAIKGGATIFCGATDSRRLPTVTGHTLPTKDRYVLVLSFLFLIFEIVVY